MNVQLPTGTLSVEVVSAQPAHPKPWLAGWPRPNILAVQSSIPQCTNTLLLGRPAVGVGAEIRGFTQMASVRGADPSGILLGGPICTSVGGEGAKRVAFVARP